jgi:hypothetical protein
MFAKLRLLLGLRALGLSLSETREVLATLVRPGDVGRHERLLDELDDRIRKRVGQLNDLRKALRDHR